MTHRTPSYRLHRPTGRAVVTIAGRDVYLGRHGTAESKAEYDRIIAEWLAGGRGRAARAAADLTVAELMVAYLEFAAGYYRDPDGNPSRELGNVKEALCPLRRLYGHTRAADFGPLALKAVRQTLVEAKLSRSTINHRTGVVKRLFKWAAANELVPPSVHHGLMAVDGLRAGRSAAREPEPVRPVPDAHVAAVLPFLTAPVRAMVEVQALCGARPGEVARMRGYDVDRSGEVWVYRPARHKTQGAGKGRAIPLGPRAQAVLAPWLRDDPAAYMFSPAEGVALRNAEKRAARKSKVPPSQAARRKARPRRGPGERFDKDAYRIAIARACDRAGVPRWHPHQLRHAVATKVRASYGLEAAQTLLGHAKADVTQIYAERDLAKAVEVMREVG